MVVDIQQFYEDQAYVNDKLIIRDMDGQWVEKIELTTAEREAWNTHLRSQEKPH